MQQTLAAAQIACLWDCHGLICTRSRPHRSTLTRVTQARGHAALPSEILERMLAVYTVACLVMKSPKQPPRAGQKATQNPGCSMSLHPC